MRRLAALLAGLGLLLAACGRDAPPEASPPQTPVPTPQEGEGPQPLPDASCDDRGGGSARNIPDFQSVDVASEGGVERVTFRFRPRDPDAGRPPSHFVKFVEELQTGPEAEPADVAGESYLLVVFSAFGVDISGEEPEQIYTGPTELQPGLSTVQELEQLGDFEATITWAIGLSEKECFVLEADPDRLVLEFPSRA